MSYYIPRQQPIQQAVQQALSDNNNNRDEASWSLYDFGSMYVNDELMHRNAIVHSNLTSISLYDKPRDKDEYTDQDWERIGIALGECNKLKKLCLIGVKLNKDIIQRLFKSRGPHSWPDFNVILLDQGVRELKTLLPALKTFPSFDTLNLSRCRGLGIQAAKLVGGLLNQTKISNLVLDGLGHNHSNLKDDGLKCILGASNAKYLVRLSVGGMYTQVGYDAISSFLRRDDTQLKVLGVTIESRERRNDIESMLVESIPNKSNLELITFDLGFRGYIHSIVKDKILKLVCNTETIQSLVDSNHKFCALEFSGWGRSYGDTDINCNPSQSYSIIRHNECKELSHAFEMNREIVLGTGSTSKAIRRKVRSFYFQKPEFDVTYFVDIDANLLPYVLDLVTRIEFRDDQWLDSRWSSIDSRWSKKKEPFLVPSYNNLNGIYRLVKNCPVALFSFPSPQVLLKEKDDTILQLKAANETMRLKLEEQTREIEQLKKCGPNPSNKRARTDDNKEAKIKSAGGDIESRLAALEADVALLKQK